MSSNFQDIKTNKLVGSYTSITISISLVIFMLGLIGLLLINAKKLSDYAKENLGFSVILINDKKEMDIIRLQKELDLADYVLETKFISKEEAARDLKENLAAMGFDDPNFRESQFIRLKMLTRHLETGRLNDSLEWV